MSGIVKLKSPAGSTQKHNYSLLAAFFFPVLVCCIGFAATGVFPFGSRSELIIDGSKTASGIYTEGKFG